MKRILFLILSAFVLFSCNNSETQNTTTSENDSLITGNIIVFHAGSLSVPFRALKKEFETQNPQVKILLEGAGSLTCARKITDLNKDCDIFASADYKIIDDMIIPEFASKNTTFASNEIVIAYSKGVKYSEEINVNNWYEILAKKDVIFARAEPDNDPCGYRTVLMWQLAEDYYNITGLEKEFLNKDKDFVRPKAIDLVALAQSKAVDYMFEYKSIATQHGFEYIVLSDSINLGNPTLVENYKKSSIEVKGKKPGVTVTFKGEPIVYGITHLTKSPNKKAAEKFMQFILSEEGKKIIKESGMTVL